MRQKFTYGVIAFLVAASMFVLGWKGQELWKESLNEGGIDKVQDQTEKNAVTKKQDVPTLQNGTIYSLQTTISATKASEAYTVEYLPGWSIISGREGVSKDGSTVTFRKELSGKPKDYLCVLFDVIPGIFTEVYPLKEGEGRIVRTLPNGYEYYEQSSPKGRGAVIYGYLTGSDRKNRILLPIGTSLIGRIEANCLSADYQTATLTYDQLVKRPEYTEAIDMLGSFRGDNENANLK